MTVVGVGIPKTEQESVTLDPVGTTSSTAPNAVILGAAVAGEGGDYFKFWSSYTVNNQLSKFIIKQLLSLKLRQSSYVWQ